MELGTNIKFKGVVTLVVLLYLFTHVTEISLGHILALAITFTVMFYMYTTEKVNIEDSNKQLEFKLDTIIEGITPTPRFLYIDPDFINLFYNIYDFKKYNPDSFIKAIKSLNNLLSIRYDFEKHKLNYSSQLYDIALEQSKLVINFIHSFIITIPSTKEFHYKHSSVLYRTQILVKRNLDIIKKYIDTTPITTKSKFITDYNGPHAINLNSDPFNENKIISNFNIY